MSIDPVTLELARNRLSSVADEMGVVLRRTSYSPNIKERADCSAAVFMADGEMLAQAEHIPVHLGSMPASVAAVLGVFGTALPPGSQYAVNDPYHGGTHLNDLTLVRPVHVDGALVALVANRAHHADVGGEAPGSMPADAVHVDQEGHRVAPTLAVRHGQWVGAFVEPFLAATRTPAERRGDLSAQLGANEAGARRLTSIVEATGVGAFLATARALLDYGQRRMEAALDALPNGEYPFDDVMEWQDELLPIRVVVTVDGARLHADFTGTSPQVAGNINAVEAVTRSCLYYAVRVATDPTIPTNGGCYRPVDLTAPPGSLVNATAPAAVAAGNVETSQRIADVVLGALAGAAPERVPAAGQGTMNNVLIGNDDFAYYETIAGGQGGRPSRAGQSGIHTGMTNTKNTPIESLEGHYPMRVLRYRLRQGSGGAGRFPGGEGIERDLLMLEEVTVSLITERRVSRPWGLAGGGPGASGENWLLPQGDEKRAERLPGKCTIRLKAGDVLRMLTPGGGGWGER